MSDFWGDRIKWKRTLRKGVVVRGKQNLGWWNMKFLGPTCYRLRSVAYGSKRRDKRRKVWWEGLDTNLDGLTALLAWLSPHCSRGSGHKKFLGNFLQTYFVLFLSGTVGTIVTGRFCRGPGELSSLRCKGTPSFCRRLGWSALSRTEEKKPLDN